MPAIVMAWPLDHTTYDSTSIRYTTMMPSLRRESSTTMLPLLMSPNHRPLWCHHLSDWTMEDKQGACPGLRLHQWKPIPNPNITSTTPHSTQRAGAPHKNPYEPGFTAIRIVHTWATCLAVTKSQP